MEAVNFLLLYTNLATFLSFHNRVFRRRKFSESMRDDRNKIIECGKWKELDIDLLEKIISDFDLKNIVVAKSVCKSWQSIITRATMTIPSPNPWLVYPCEYIKRLCCHDMFDHRDDNKTHTCKLPKLIRSAISSKGRICGSSKGWLVVVTNTRLFLFDPLSGDQYELPSLTTIPYYTYHGGVFSYDQIELSSNDLSECIVAFMIGYGSLACCRPKDDRWTIFDDYDHSSPLGSTYIAFCYETLYVGLSGNLISVPLVRDCKITTRSSTMKLGDDDDDDEHLLNIKLVPSLDELGLCCMEPYNKVVEVMYDSVVNYLVESNKKNGNLILIRQYEAGMLHTKDHYEYENERRPNKFKLFELSPDSGCDGCDSYSVKRVTSLGDQEALFVVKGKTAFVLSTGTNVGRMRGNCIYSTELGDRTNYGYGYSSAIFDIGDGKIEKCCTLEIKNTDEEDSLYWFIPHPRYFQVS